MNYTKQIFHLGIIAILLILGNTAFGQKVGITANFGQFNIDKIESETADIDYDGSTSLDLNLRIFTKNKWAFRVGAGLDKLNYTVDGASISTDYKAKRNDLRGEFGIEKHFMVGRWLDIYPGAYVPITITGEDVIDTNFANIKNGEMTAGLGMVLGANVGIFKVLRLGVEFDATFNDFKNGVWESAETLSVVPLKGIKTNTSFTLGLMF